LNNLLITTIRFEIGTITGIASEGIFSILLRIMLLFRYKCTKFWWGSQGLGVGCKVQGTGCWVQGSRYRVQGMEFDSMELVWEPGFWNLELY